MTTKQTIATAIGAVTGKPSREEQRRALVAAEAARTAAHQTAHEALRVERDVTLRHLAEHKHLEREQQRLDRAWTHLSTVDGHAAAAHQRNLEALADPRAIAFLRDLRSESAALSVLRGIGAMPDKLGRAEALTAVVPAAVALLTAPLDDAAVGVRLAELRDELDARTAAATERRFADEQAATQAREVRRNWL